MKRKISHPKKDSEYNRSLAFNYSLKYLSFRPRSVKEVYDYLLKKNFVDETINYVLKKLLDSKFLDDKSFGEQWIESRQKYKNKSRFIIKNELRQKGLNSTTIDELMINSKEDFETAKILFDKKKKTLEKLPVEEFKRKMAGFLQRRGFSYEVISKLLRS